MFASFARIVRAYRLYNADNATVVRMIDELWRGFGDVLEVTPELVITVQANALLLGEASLLETADTDESIPFALYRDGIRRIEFLHGLPRDELEALVEATSLGLGFTGVGDDVVSLLWRRDLRHISYVVVDTTIVESDGRVATERGDASTVDAQINALLASLYGHSDDVEGRLSLHLDGADLPAKRVAEALDDVEDMAAGGRPVRHLGQRAAYQDDLEREVAEEGDFAISVRGLEGALRSLAQPLPPAEARTMADALLRMLDTALLEDRFQVATGIVSGVRRSGQSRPSWAAGWTRWCPRPAPATWPPPSTTPRPPRRSAPPPSSTSAPAARGWWSRSSGSCPASSTPSSGARSLPCSSRSGSSTPRR
ncbi:MAG: hypothetical protein H6730_02420 [Deltaproteobacteria bacterium]|nr:hypothetical protein [Deltaproteobacteria bacterium]